MPAFAGNLRQYPLVDVLRSLESRQMSGLLMLRYPQLEVHIFLGRGQWLLAERPGDTTPLGVLLAQSGCLTPDQYEQAVGVSLADAHTVSDVQTARMLMSARMLGREQFNRWALQDARALLEYVSRLPGGDFAFEEQVGPPPTRFPIPIPITQLLQPAHTTPGPSESQGAAPDFGAAAMPSRPRGSDMSSGGMGIRDQREMPRPSLPVHPDALIIFPQIGKHATGSVTLTRDQWRVLTMVDGHSSPRAIAANLQAPEPVVMRILGELLNNGIVQMGSFPE